MPADKNDIPTPEEANKNDAERLEQAAVDADEVVETAEDAEVLVAQEKLEQKTEEPSSVAAPEDTKMKEGVPQGKTLKKGEYIEGLGRRKRATARVRIFSVPAADAVASKDFEINGMQGKEFFQAWQHETVIAPLERSQLIDKIAMTVQVKGGGITGQAEAVRMGLSRALVELEPSLKGKLKRAGFLTRDPREKERKKYGLRKARRAPQFSKR